MKKDNLYIGQQARVGIMQGIAKGAYAVRVTMGTGGANSLIECIESPGHFSTNDGATILSSMKFADPLEEIGRKILEEAVSRANKSSGDGSSTTCVLTSSILEEGIKHLGKSSPMEIKRSLEKCIPFIEEAINKDKKQIGVDEVGEVAAISAEDKKIGEVIQEIYKKIGKDGIIHWDVSKTPEDSYSLGKGITMHGATYVSPYMCDIDSSGTFNPIIRWKDVPVLLTKQKITSGSDFENLFSQLFRENVREIVIFCDEIEIPAVADLVRTRAVRGFKALVIKMPTLWKDEWWEDLSLATGAPIIGGTSGTSLADATDEHLGKIGNLVVNKEDTFIDGIKDISSHIEELKKGDEASQLRASRLNVKTARYYVGGYSESSLAYRRLKVEDAINAASCALDNGVVAGGGIALYEAIKSLPKDEIGSDILKEALKSPLVCIITNTGFTPLEGEIEKEKGVHIDTLKKGFGFDTQTQKVVHMLQAGIIDPTDVVINAIKSAIGVAASILTMETVITLPHDEDLRRMPSM